MSIATAPETYRGSITREQWLIDETGPAAFVGMPWAMADVVALEEADPEELVCEAERRGWDLHCFEA